MAVGASAAIQQGLYTVLSVRMPAQTAKAVGIILIDELDRAYVRLSDALFTTDEDILEVWAHMLDTLHAYSQELGGEGLLRLLEATASNFLEIGPIAHHSIDDPQAQVNLLYDRYVVSRDTSSSPRLSKTGSEVKPYSYADITRARQVIPSTGSNAVHLVLAYRAGDLGIARLERFVEGDPSLAAQIVRLANLSGHSRGQIRSVRQALIQIGIDVAIGYIMALTLKPLYSSPALRGVWAASLQCRAMAVELATLLGVDNPQEHALIALIADLGKVVLISLDGYEQRYQHLRAAGNTPLVCEHILCGSTHAEVSAAVLADWSFPADMVESVRHHHTPTGKVSIGASIAYVATCTVESLETECDLEEHRAACQNLNLSRGTMGRALQEQHINASTLLLS